MVEIFAKVALVLMMALSPASAINYGPHNRMTLEEIKEKVNFKLLVPQEVPQIWILEIKTSLTYPFTSLHYLDENDEYLIVGIDQKMTTVGIGVLTDGGEVVNINGYEGRFHAWGGPHCIIPPKITPGGILEWVQNGTYINISSTVLTEDEMIKLAKSMK